MFSSTTSAEVPYMCNFVSNHFYLLLRCFLAGHDRIVLCLLAWLFESGLTLKPGFHITVRVVPVAPVFSNYVQATGTIIWKHHRDDRGRSKKTEKTGTTAVAWIENVLSERPKRSRETVNILMETTFGRPGRPKRLRRPKISHNALYYVPYCVPKMAGSTELFLNKERFME